MLSYQGKLTDTFGLPVVDTTYSVNFRLYSAPSGGSSFWNETQTVRTREGLFSALLGSVTSIGSMPDAGAVYLGMAVEGGPELAPRLRIASAAYAYLAARAAYADLLQGKDTAALDVRYVNEAQANSITSVMIANGTIAAVDLNQMGATANQVLKWTGSAWAPRNDSVGGGAGDNAWVRSGSDSVLYTINLLGIARGGSNNALYGNQRFTHVNLGVACTTGTSGQNYRYATVGGGWRNVASDSFAMVAGGSRNTASGIYATVAGGQYDTASANFATVGGGFSNSASGNTATIGGGYNNDATDSYATVAGGYNNDATGTYATVAGGQNNTADTAHATVGGGYNNDATGTYATVAGGQGNTADTAYATVGGGGSNGADAAYATVAGGYSNDATGTYATVAGGYNNTASGDRATVGGGINNAADTTYATVGGGYNNAATGYGATVGGGYSNAADTNYATVGGGINNDATGHAATVGGGSVNDATGSYATVAGGYYNVADTTYATVAGGFGDTAMAYASGALSGRGNVAGDEAVDSCAVICGGRSNAVTGRYGAVGGGQGNSVAGWCGTVAGGYQNSAGGFRSTVGGGEENSASGWRSTVSGGSSDTAAADYSFATNNNSTVSSSYTNSAAFNGQTATASNQTRVGALSKASGTFTIDHPLDPHGKILNHYFIEGPEMRNIYDGEAVLEASGRAVVMLPDYFDALNRKPRVQLTGVGTADVYLAEKVSGNRFVIGGKPGTDVYWQVTGERKDVSAEATRRMMPVEQPKTGALAGRMLDDEFISGCMDQLVSEGKASGIDFRTAGGRARYERMRQQGQEGK
jgi:hypothetical protein